MRVSLYTKTGLEVDALDMDALIEHQSCGEQGIKPAGDQGDGFFLVGHGNKNEIIKGWVL